MENKLTSEEIAKVLMIYWQSKFRYEGSLGVTRTVMGITRGWNITDDTEEDVSYRVDKCKLLLTPLSEITDEDATALFIIEHNYNATYTKMEYLPTGEYVGLNAWNNSRIKCGIHWHKLTYSGFQYLISKDYAVHLFFGIDHWANGKTAIELNIAIKK